jgi:hypothetical protein
MEPTPFSIDEKILEKTLLNIGSGSQKATSQQSLPKAASAVSSSPRQLEKVAAALQGIPDDYKEDCISYLLNQVSRFKANMVCQNTKKLGSSDCVLGKKNNQIIYRNASVQGDWTGLEVIIDGEGSNIVVARSDGKDWQDVTDLYKIAKT